MTFIEIILVLCIIVLVLLLESLMKTTKKAFADAHQLESERSSLQFQIKQLKAKQNEKPDSKTELLQE